MRRAQRNQRTSQILWRLVEPGHSDALAGPDSTVAAASWNGVQPAFPREPGLTTCVSWDTMGPASEQGRTPAIRTAEPHEWGLLAAVARPSVRPMEECGHAACSTLGRHGLEYE